MFKIVLATMCCFMLVNASSISQANAAAKDAVRGLDCEFEDCSKPEPQIIIKEKKVYIDRPVEKVVVKEKVVYRDKVVYKDKPTQTPQADANDNRVYNKAFFDIHTKSQAPILDYITFNDRSSFDIKQYIDSVTKIKENSTKVYIYGSIAVPESIKTEQVYIYNGDKYFYHYYDWGKKIYYNNSKNRQNSDYFLVNVKKDANGKRYVDYKIYLLLEHARDLKESEENVAPNTFFFKMAPKVRGFKNKFVKAKIFIVE